MLKKRILGVVVVRDGLAVQSIGFNRYLPIGRPEIVVEYLNIWGIDEIAVVDITATASGQPNIDLVRKLSHICQVPMTYGGGITTAEEMTRLVQAGADKVMINQAFLLNPKLVSAGAELLGSQCVVVSIDTQLAQNKVSAFNYRTHRQIEQDIISLAKLAESYGAGEIFLNSVDRDGAKTGYDLKTIESVASAISIPITACGGVGKAEHFADALSIENVSAAAAGNYFNFAEHSVALTKQFIIQKDLAKLRHDTYFNYNGAQISTDGRLLKKSDHVLKELLFEYHEKEVI